jgi:hypothetical protein
MHARLTARAPARPKRESTAAASTAVEAAVYRCAVQQVADLDVARVEVERLILECGVLQPQGQRYLDDQQAGQYQPADPHAAAGGGC